MSERIQRTAASLKEKMLQRYGEASHHKHDKTHDRYRDHCPSHPIVMKRIAVGGEEVASLTPTGHIRKLNLRKFRRGLVAKGRIH